MGNRKIFNNIAESYKNEWNISKVEKENIRKIIKYSGIKKKDVILEPGCGKGDFSLFILKKLKEGFLYSVDVSEKMLFYAKEKLLKYKNVRLINYDAKNIKIKSGYFDKIICFNCFPHFYPKEKYIKEFARLLKKDGYLIIAHSISRKKINNLHKRFGFNMKKHFLPDFSQMKKILKKYNFKINKNFNKNFYFIKAQKYNL